MRGLGDWPQAALQDRPPLQLREDRFHDAIDVAVDLVVVESSDPLALTVQKLLALRVAHALIAGRMVRLATSTTSFCSRQTKSAK